MSDEWCILFVVCAISLLPSDSSLPAPPCAKFELRDDDDGLTDATEFTGLCIDWAPWVNGSRAWFKITCPRAVDTFLADMDFKGGAKRVD